MHRLTRQVRFAINTANDPQLAAKPINGHAGFPSITGYGPYLSLDVTLSGPIDPSSRYLINIKQIDSVVRQRAVPVVAEAVLSANQTPPRLLARLYDILQVWPSLT